MKYLEKLYKDSKTTKFSKLNLFTIKLLLVSIFLVPFLFLIRTLISQSGAFSDSNKWSIATWILSIISFISGLVSVILSIKGLNHNFGSKFLFIINVLVGIFALLLLSGLVFLPKMYIIF